MKKLLRELFTIRVRMDLNHNEPMIAFYFCKVFLGAVKYDSLNTQKFYEIQEKEYKDI